MQPQELYQLFSQRQSDRRFDPNRPIPEEILTRILDNSLLAPSACNEQPWQTVVVTEPELVKKVAQAARKGSLGQNKFIEQAPVHILLVADPPSLLAKFGGKVRGVDYVQNDLGIFTAYLTLAAAAEGIGSCIIGWLNGGAVSEVLGIPKNKKVFLDIVLGYSLDPVRSKKRKPKSQLLHFNKW